MMRVLLVNPNISPEKAYGRRFMNLGEKVPPLGLCYLAAVLEQHRHIVAIIDANCENLSFLQILDRVALFRPDIIGITAVTLVIEECEKLAAQIKQLMPKVFIVLGGPHISGFGKEALQCKYFDFGIIGEGEYVFSKLLNKLEAKEDFDGLEGLVYKKNLNIIDNGPAPLIDKLDSLPHPSRHLLPRAGRYHTKVFNSRDKSFGYLITSRGCPFKCIFCNSPLGKKVRLHSQEYVVDEITRLVKDYGAKDIKIDDDVLNWNAERIFAIFDSLKVKGIEVPWSCNLRVDLVKNNDFFRQIKKRGCWLVRMGIESGNQIVLDNLKKGINLGYTKKVCKWAQESGLRIQAHFIIANPLDSEKTIGETVSFAKSLPVDYPTFTIMTPFPGTELWDTASQYGKFEYSRFSDLALSYNPCFIPKELSRDIILKWHRRAYLSSYLNLKMVFRHIRKIDSFYECRKLLKAAGSLLGSG
jgi:radical SAM superfamily enzyme YgiQ (UPF0313 family)